MVEHTPYFIFGLGMGALVMTFFWGRFIDRMILKFYDEQCALINKFYGELHAQSDKFFSIMKEYIREEEVNDD